MSDDARDGSTRRAPAAHPPAGLGRAAARRPRAPRPVASSGWVLQTERDASEIGGGFRKDMSLSSDAVTPGEQQVIDKYHRHLRQLSMSLHEKPDPLHSVTVFHDGPASRWVAGLSGSGSVYGSAGAIQMALAPRGMTLREVLARTSLALSSSPFLSIDALTGGRPAPPPAPSAAERERVARALGAAAHMNSGRILALVDVPGADPMTALRWMAQTVPERLCQTAWWSTALLLNNPSSSRRIIATPWPQVLAQRHPREKALIDDNVRAAAPSNDADEQRLLHWYTDLVLGGEGAATRNRAETAFLNTCNARTAPPQWDALAPVWLESINQVRPLSDEEIVRVINGEDDRSLLQRWTNECAERALKWEDAVPVLIGHAEPAVSSSALRALAGSQAGFMRLCQWQAEEIGRAALSTGPPAGIGQTGYGAAPGDAARAGATGIEAPRALLALQDKPALIREVLKRLRASKGVPPDAWAPQAESWIRSLGLRPRDFDAHLPLTADRAVERFVAAPHDLSPVMTMVSRSTSREAALDVMLRALREAPFQQGALLSALYKDPPRRDLNWRVLLNRLIPKDTRLADVPGKLDALNESLPDGSDELRREIVKELLERRGMLARAADDRTGAGKDAAIALLAFCVDAHHRVSGPPGGTGAGAGRAPEWTGVQKKWLAIAIAVAVAVVVIAFLVWMH